MQKVMSHPVLRFALISAIFWVGCGHSSDLFEDSKNTTNLLESGRPPPPEISQWKSDFSCPAHPERSETGVIPDDPKPSSVETPKLLEGSFLATLNLDERRGAIFQASQGGNMLTFRFHSADESLQLQFCLDPNCAERYRYQIIIHGNYYIPLKTWVPLRIAWKITPQKATVWLFIDDHFYFEDHSPGLIVGGNLSFEKWQIGDLLDSQNNAPLKGQILATEFLAKPWLKGFSQDREAQRNCIDPVSITDPQYYAGITPYAGRLAWNPTGEKLLVAMLAPPLCPPGVRLCDHWIYEVATQKLIPLPDIATPRIFWGLNGDQFIFLKNFSNDGVGRPLPPLLIRSLWRGSIQDIARISGVTAPPVTSYGFSSKGELILVQIDTCNPQAGVFRDDPNAQALCQRDPSSPRKGWRVNIESGEISPTVVPDTTELSHPLWAEFPYRTHAHSGRSPDGKWIATAKNGTGVVLQSVSDGSQKVIFPAWLPNHLSWGPTSEWFVVSSSPKSGDDLRGSTSFDANQLWQVFLDGRYRSLAFINTSERANRPQSNAVPQVSPKGDKVAFTSDDCTRELKLGDRRECVYLLDIPPEGGLRNFEPQPYQPTQ